ncbi:hypothetical protein [Streptomyces sp. NBC_00353]|uniref:hypothetical protein n=1 Tax=unclassified Streptomyces TaxID=2593676 RepID=UPI002E265FBA
MCNKVEQERQRGVRQFGKPGQRVGGPGPGPWVLIVEEVEQGGNLGKHGVVRTHRRVTGVDRIARRHPVPDALHVPASMLVLLGGQGLLVQGEELVGGVLGGLRAPDGDVGAVDDLVLLVPVDREVAQERQRALTRRRRAGESDPDKERHRVRRCLTAGALVREMVEQVGDGLLLCLLVVSAQGA